MKFLKKQDKHVSYVESNDFLILFLATLLWYITIMFFKKVEVMNN